MTTTHPWYHNPEAQALFASFTDNPPQRIRITIPNPHNRGEVERLQYTGKRVDRLTEIHLDAGAVILKKCDAVWAAIKAAGETPIDAETHAEFHAWAEQPSVEDLLEKGYRSEQVAA